MTSIFSKVNSVGRLIFFVLSSIVSFFHFCCLFLSTKSFVACSAYNSFILRLTYLLSFSSFIHSCTNILSLVPSYSICSFLDLVLDMPEVKYWLSHQFVRVSSSKYEHQLKLDPGEARLNFYFVYLSPPSPSKIFFIYFALFFFLRLFVSPTHFKQHSQPIFVLVITPSPILFYNVGKHLAFLSLIFCLPPPPIHHFVFEAIFLVFILLH